MKYEIKKELINFRDIDFPETLYKYRFWSKEMHQRIITHREVFFSAPSDFEDPFDCKIPTRWDLLSNEDILNYYFKDSLNELGNNISIWERIEFAIHHANNNELRDERFLARKQQEHFNEYDKRIGVLSLTPFNNLNELWENYADSHEGFCIGFEPSYMLENIGTGAGLVNYTVELPIIYPSIIMPFDVQMHHQMFSKKKIWEGESEYRTFISKNGHLTIEERQKIISPEAFKEIILGAKMSQANVDDIISKIPNELNGVPIKKAHFTNGRMELVSVKN